ASSPPVITTTDNTGARLGIHFSAGLLGRSGSPGIWEAIHRQSVSRWVKEPAAGGKASLPRGSTAVERGLRHGPNALGYVSGLLALDSDTSERAPLVTTIPQKGDQST
ncbi:MAG: hypothetical protein NTY23_11215, partial [Chloroflexi bacterium]|nr:hypothetical protein [Chloroflexota bacterium]